MWRVIERLTIDDHDFAFEFDSHRDAYLSARQFACARGAVFVKVIAPDGSIAHEWSAKDAAGAVDNRWHAHAGHPV